MLDTRLSSGIKEEHQKSENKTYYHLYWRWKEYGIVLKYLRRIRQV